MQQPAQEYSSKARRVWSVLASTAVMVAVAFLAMHEAPITPPKPTPSVSPAPNDDLLGNISQSNVERVPAPTTFTLIVIEADQGRPVEGACLMAAEESSPFARDFAPLSKEVLGRTGLDGVAVLAADRSKDLVVAKAGFAPCLVKAPDAGSSAIVQLYALVQLRVVLQGVEGLPEALRDISRFRLVIEPEVAETVRPRMVVVREELRCAEPDTSLMVAPRTRYRVTAAHEIEGAVDFAPAVEVYSPAVVVISVKLSQSALLAHVVGHAEAVSGRAVMVGPSRNLVSDVSDSTAVFNVHDLPNGEYRVSAYGEDWISKAETVFVKDGAPTPDALNIQFAQSAVIIIDIAGPDGSPALTESFGVMYYHPTKRIWAHMTDVDRRPGIPFFWSKGARLVLHQVNAVRTVLVRIRGVADYSEVDIVPGIATYAVGLHSTSEIVFESAAETCQTWSRRNQGAKGHVFLDMGVDISGAELSWITLKQARTDGDALKESFWKIRGNPHRRFRVRIRGDGGTEHHSLAATVVPG
jgi:hypothetical protein